MTERRHTDKFRTDPSAVTSLSPLHPAMTENRTLFPGQVVEVTGSSPARILVSGRENRKLGAHVAKGAFAGYALYQLSLEERATCPTDCDARAFCFGNAMHKARRHRIGDRDIFFDRIGMEILTLIDEHGGLLVRLHVLGDFPDVEYVSFWAEQLDENPKLAIYGYTHHSPTSWGGSDIGDAIQSVKDRHPDRFRIRWSGLTPRPDGARIINYIPKRPRVDEGLVCPAQTEDTASCSTCGLCWDATARRDTIVFIKHGVKNLDGAAEHEQMKASEPTRPLKEQPALTPADLPKVPPASMPGVFPADRLASVAVARVPMDAPNPPLEASRIGPVEIEGKPLSAYVASPAQMRSLPPGVRRIREVAIPSAVKPKLDLGPAPEARLVKPTDLLIEASYQRDLTGRSLRLIRKIVGEWSWAKYKPPVCVETPEGLFVIDGQHTAIAAATHPMIGMIPVMVVRADKLETRAEAFVSHNRSRLTMSPYQIFHANLTAKNPDTLEINAIMTDLGITVPRYVRQKQDLKPRTLAAIDEAGLIYRVAGAARLRRVLSIAVLGGHNPISTTILRAIRMILEHSYFREAADLPDDALGCALSSIMNFDSAAMARATTSGQNRYRAGATLIAEKAKAAT